MVWTTQHGHPHHLCGVHCLVLLDCGRLGDRSLGFRHLLWLDGGGHPGTVPRRADQFDDRSKKGRSEGWHGFQRGGELGKCLVSNIFKC